MLPKETTITIGSLNAGQTIIEFQEEDISEQTFMIVPSEQLHLLYVALEEHLYGQHVFRAANNRLDTEVDANYVVQQTIRSYSTNDLVCSITYCPRYTINVCA